ncbi:hypothetical protein FM111_08595 [Brevundimonas diminuta 3F5N]|uniref:Uracil DNA glycosylase superfamily protein n=1 Tax=Brevundimonas diminuta 3F5N TaxID=1255603 RepID=A0A1R4G1H4_BREDI|nr:hypothetical protein [Brevundimonas diminuta]SJM61937.1 hypothetical protein FM111_08595 [Brevundimonas diminuta 3F5N]
MQTLIDAARAIDLTAYRQGGPPPDLTISNHDAFSITYAPFDFINRSAELVLVGLTPGRTQAANAIEALQKALASGKSQDEALKIAKSTASFSGAMRNALVAMLDAVGVPQKFGRRSAQDFFIADSDLVHFTSALRYPVYLANGDNYSGAPSPLAQPALRSLIETHLAEEAAALPKAIWVPLGGHAEASLQHLAARGALDSRRVLSGLPHPSGANAERIAYFLGRKSRDQLSVKTNADKIDAARTTLLRQVAALDA